jgi:RNA polymerase sigma-70 factor (ECF subfamily)
MTEDYIILEQLARDDERAYTALYKLFYVPLLLFSRKYVNDERSEERRVGKECSLWC